MRKIKMLWDFRGATAKKTAEHHCIHLKEYFETENIESLEVAVETYSEMFCAAIAIVDEIHVEKCRADLKPNRGQLVEE